MVYKKVNECKVHVLCNADICPPGSSKTQSHFTQMDKQPSDICLCHTTAIFLKL